MSLDLSRSVKYVPGWIKVWQNIFLEVSKAFKTLFDMLMAKQKSLDVSRTKQNIVRRVQCLQNVIGRVLG
jgi:hypothetical protein